MEKASSSLEEMKMSSSSHYSLSASESESQASGRDEPVSEMAEFTPYDESVELQAVQRFHRWKRFHSEAAAAAYNARIHEEEEEEKEMQFQRRYWNEMALNEWYDHLNQI